MARFKLRKGVELGKLGAENDKNLLEKVFVDQGHIDHLLDPDSPQFLILGRTGSGKTALIEQVKARVEHVSELNPEELSMQYLHNSQVLKQLIQWGVNLDVFYKFLWRHVCILQFIRMRYEADEDTSGLVDKIVRLVSSSKRDEEQAREEARRYLHEYGEEFWQTTDTRIKKLVNEVENTLRGDAQVDASLRAGLGQLSGRAGSSGESREKQQIEKEVVERAQKIVSNYLIADLRRIIELLGKAGFNDPQRRYFIVIDDLDKNWMPDDDLYLGLVKSLLYTVYELNRTSPLKGIKVIVSLRENIYHKVFQKVGIHEPQREKWLDVQVRLLWSKEELVELVDRRLEEVLREEYTQAVPTLNDILPPKRRTHEEDALEFILQRTFMRPRDIIDYLNTCLKQIAERAGILSWSTLTQAEVEFSQRRLDSVIDEWKDSFFGLPALFSTIRRLGPKFQLSDITENEVNDVLSSERCDSCPWLSSLQVQFCTNRMSSTEIAIEFLKALYLIGIVGYKQTSDPMVVYAFDKPLTTSPAVLNTTRFYVHRMFWSAFHFPMSQKVEAGV